MARPDRRRPPTAGVASLPAAVRCCGRAPGADDRDAHRGCPIQDDQLAQRVGRQLAEPCLAGAGANHCIGQRALVGDQRVDRSSIVPWHTSLWTNTDWVCRCATLGRWPGPRRQGSTSVVVHDRVAAVSSGRCRRPERHEQQWRGGALLERADHPVARLARPPPCRNGPRRAGAGARDARPGAVARAAICRNWVNTNACSRHRAGR